MGSPSCENDPNGDLSGVEDLPPRVQTPDASYNPGIPDPPPLPPQNGEVVNPYIFGILDLRWDNPALLAGNSLYTVVGVNVYRSDVSDRGPFFRLNEFPVGGTFYRDLTETILINREAIPWDTGWTARGDAPNDRRWTLQTSQPIVKSVLQAPYERNTPANAPSDVTVYIDGYEVPVEAVFGPTGEVTLVNWGEIDNARQRIDAPRLPAEGVPVEVSYHTSRNYVRSGLGTNIHYRLATVIIDPTTPSGYRETPLSYTPALISGQTESLDYIWREAVRRNQWILQQGGERAKVFIRRMAGVPCTHGLDPMTVEFAGQPSQRCKICFGTGFVGGYEGPFDIIMAPDDAERKISQTPWGRRKEHSQEVWTGPSPVLTMRDFIVKQTNERYSVGPVRRPTNRGVYLQQHFNIGSLDEGDIRYQVPIDGVEKYVWPMNRWTIVQTPTRFVDAYPPTLEQRLINGLDARILSVIDPTGNRVDLVPPGAPPFPVDSTAEAPMGTEHDSMPNEVEQRGRSTVWSNISRVVIPPLLLLPRVWEVLQDAVSWFV